MSDKGQKNDIFKGKIQSILKKLIFGLPLIIFPISIILWNQPFMIFPTLPVGTSRNEFTAYTDAGVGGKSTVEDFHYDSRVLVCRYTLRRQISSPMVFILSRFDFKGIPLDLSAFSSVSIRFKDVTARRVLIVFKTFVPGITQNNDKNMSSFRINQFIMHPNEDVHDYKIDFNRFTTDTEWYKTMGLPINSLPDETFSKAAGFEIQFSFAEYDSNDERRENVVIDQIMLEKPFFSPLNLILLGLTAAGCASFAFFILLRKKIVDLHPLPDGKTLNVSSYRDDELHQIRQYIEAHYNDPDISTDMIYKALGINATRVYNILKEKYNLSFKQIINGMRIEESKRLLRQTDLKVLAIALNLGFNDISYFNRIFKLEVGVSPSDYRKMNDKAHNP